MHYLLGTTPPLLLAALLLVVVASLPASGLAELRARWSVFVFTGALLLTSALVWQAFERSKVLVDGLPSRVLRNAVAELADPAEPNVVLIEGGSYALNGVDAPTVREELLLLGYRARVVRLAASGANHFERYRMQEGIVERLSGRPRPGQRWIYLAEVQAGYDRKPLSQFDSNDATNRLYHYTTADNSWQMLRALHSPGVHLPLRGDFYWALLRPTLVNAFSVGAASRYVPEASVELRDGTVIDARVSYRRFEGLSEQLALAMQPRAEPSLLPWLLQVRERRLRRLWRRYLTHFGYFGLPTTATAQISYVRGFCAGAQSPCISPSVELLGHLDDRKYWRDKGHLRKSGAVIYSRWLARQVASSGVLQK